MSGKTAKAARRADEAKKQEYLLRKEAMLKDIKNLSSRYKIDLVPVIRYMEQGIYPLLAFVDMSDQYESKKAEIKQTDGEKKPNGQGKLETRLET